MDKFSKLIKRFNDKENALLLVEILDAISSSKDKDGHAAKVENNISEGGYHLCNNDHDRIENFEITCCKKKAHKTCLTILHYVCTTSH